MDTATSVYLYRDMLGRALYVGITTRGLRRQHEFAESKIWWPLVETCQIMHFSTKEEAIRVEQEIRYNLSPPFNTEDKRLSMAHYYKTDPVVVFKPSAELRREILRWRSLPKPLRETHHCVNCDRFLALELLDGYCGLCHVASKDRRLMAKRQDGKSWKENKII